MPQQFNLVAVISFDIDGVLQSSMCDDPLADHCTALLAGIIRHTRTSAVLPSAWRADLNKISMVNAVFEDCAWLTFDVTPELFGRRCETEICAWLDSHGGVRSWIVIDGMDLESGGTEASGRMRGHFVRTSQDVGIVEKDAQLASQFLRHHWLKRRRQPPRRGRRQPSSRRAPDLSKHLQL